VDVHRRLVVEVVQQVFAVRLGVDQRAAVEQRGPRGEPALRAGHPDRLPGEERPVPPGEAVNGVSLWHSSNSSRAFALRRIAGIRGRYRGRW
jgi:hypothetical protein